MVSHFGSWSVRLSSLENDYKQINDCVPSVVQILEVKYVSALMVMGRKNVVSVDCAVLRQKNFRFAFIVLSVCLSFLNS